MKIKKAFMHGAHSLLAFWFAIWATNTMHCMINLKIDQKPSGVPIYTWTKIKAQRNTENHLLVALHEIGTTKISLLDKIKETIKAKPIKIKLKNKSKEPFVSEIKNKIYEIFQSNTKIKELLNVTEIYEKKNEIRIKTNFENAYGEKIKQIRVINSLSQSIGTTRANTIEINQEKCLHPESYYMYCIKFIICHELAHIILGHNLLRAILDIEIEKKLDKTLEALNLETIQHSLKNLPADAQDLLSLFEDKSNIYSGFTENENRIKNKLENIKGHIEYLDKATEIEADIVAIFDDVELANEGRIFAQFSPDLIFEFQNNNILQRIDQEIEKLKQEDSVFDFSHNGKTHPATLTRLDYIGKILDKKLEETTLPEIKAFYQKGLQYLEKKNSDKALEYFTTIIAKAEKIKLADYPFYKKSLQCILNISKDLLNTENENNHQTALCHIIKVAESLDVDTSIQAKYMLGKIYCSNGQDKHNDLKAFHLFCTTYLQNHNAIIKEKSKIFIDHIAAIYNINLKEETPKIDTKTGHKRTRDEIEDKDYEELNRKKKKAKHTI